MIATGQIEKFIAAHRLPPEFAILIENYYIPLAKWILQRKRASKTPLIGVNGAQGTGKSTLAAFLKIALESAANWNVVVMSIDDFYLTKDERSRLADEVHPLLRTRGVPGTHDIEMLSDCVDKLEMLGAGSELPVPRFDKATDDRADRSEWSFAVGPVDLILVEGWCVGSEPQQAAQLVDPINSLEKTDDADGRWRTFANDNLQGVYARLFARLDALVLLQAPDFSAVHRWRSLQEEELAMACGKEASGIMNSQQLALFIQHYERITRHNLSVLPELADVVLELNEAHDCTGSYYKGESVLMSDQSSP